MLRKRIWCVFMLDSVLIGLAFALSFLLRFDFAPPADMGDLFWRGFFVVLLVKPLILFGNGFYRNLWSYASLRDAIGIFKSVSLSTLMAASIILFSRYFAPFPRSVIILDWLLLLFFISASRLSWRLYREVGCSSGSAKGLRTLIVGAGEAGSLLMKEIRRQADFSLEIVGFVDDDETKQGMYLDGVQVLGKLSQLPEIVLRESVEEVVIAIPSARSNVFRCIFDHCGKVGVRCRTLPRISDIIDGKISVSQIKDVEFDDLLGREAIVLDESGIRDYLAGKRVLISGAAGSIGSEICRQVARFRPDTMILLDNAETPLFHIERELRAAFPDLKIIPVIGDVKNKEKIEKLFNDFRPEVVFHAAAYKHVRMMEFNPAEAVLNNVAGTKVMADAANRYHVRDFVMISTDKAVNPTNVMGASKRVAEMYVQALSGRSLTRFTTVRFGNVIGSNGSVIPIFLEQIRKGGPVTVTDPNVVRYFMTIPEASQLVLQAGCMGASGDIFVLDMGDPVRIKDLAEELIRLSGLIPYEDIDIVYTGLSPGEKLFEELLTAGEGVKPTTHEKIRIAAAVQTDFLELTCELARLFGLAAEVDTAGVMKSLRGLVREFNPRYSFTGPVPASFQVVRPDLFPGMGTAPVPAKILPLRNFPVASHLPGLPGQHPVVRNM